MCTCFCLRMESKRVRTYLPSLFSILATSLLNRSPRECTDVERRSRPKRLHSVTIVAPRILELAFDAANEEVVVLQIGLSTSNMATDTCV